MRAQPVCVAKGTIAFDSAHARPLVDSISSVTLRDDVLELRLVIDAAHLPTPASFQRSH